MADNSSILEQYNLFCKKHESKEVESSGTRWNYIVGGQGSETIFIFSGGSGRVEDIFRYILDLENNYRIIAPSIPSNITTILSLSRVYLQY